MSVELLEVSSCRLCGEPSRLSQSSEAQDQGSSGRRCSKGISFWNARAFGEPQLPSQPMRPPSAAAANRVHDYESFLYFGRMHLCFKHPNGGFAQVTTTETTVSGSGTSAVATSEPALPDGYYMSGGTVMVVRGGQRTVMDRDATLPSGVLITRSGTVTLPDGNTTTLKAGQVLGMDGKISSVTAAVEGSGVRGGGPAQPVAGGSVGAGADNTATTGAASPSGTSVPE